MLHSKSNQCSRAERTGGLVKTSVKFDFARSYPKKRSGSCIEESVSESPRKRKTSSKIVEEKLGFSEDRRWLEGRSCIGCAPLERWMRIQQVLVRRRLTEKRE
jgi:hypothetical protein